MTAHHDLDRELTAFLREGPTELPDESLDAVFDRTEQTRQRAFIGPWRLPDMNKFVTYGLGAVAVVVLLFAGSQFFGEAGGLFGADPTPTATPEATLEPTPEPTATPEPAPPLTQSFSSTLYGYSVSYPEGWTAQAATEPWTASTFARLFGEAHADFLYDPILMDHLFLTVASQPIGDSTPEDWLTERIAGDEGCTSTEPITVDGATGLIGVDECSVAVVVTAGRGYIFQLLASDDDPPAVAAYDQAWFEEVLATVQLHPEDAVD